jgi:hypothetical protein
MRETRVNPDELRRQVKAEGRRGGASFRFTLPLAPQPDHQV